MRAQPDLPDEELIPYNKFMDRMREIKREWSRVACERGANDTATDAVAKRFIELGRTILT
jgi:hypothetical protein